MTTLERLERGRAWLADPGQWRKGARGYVGESPCCAIGALGERRLGDAAENALLEALPAGECSVINYNDRPSTTHADILALYDRAIAAERPRVAQEAQS